MCVQWAFTTWVWWVWCGEVLCSPWRGRQTDRQTDGKASRWNLSRLQWHSSNQTIIIIHHPPSLSPPSPPRNSAFLPSPSRQSTLHSTPSRPLHSQRLPISIPSRTMLPSRVGIYQPRATALGMTLLACLPAWLLGYFAWLLAGGGAPLARLPTYSPHVASPHVASTAHGNALHAPPEEPRSRCYTYSECMHTASACRLSVQWCEPGAWVPGVGVYLQPCFCQAATATITVLHCMTGRACLCSRYARYATLHSTTLHISSWCRMLTDAVASHGPVRLCSFRVSARLIGNDVVFGAQCATRASGRVEFYEHPSLLLEAVPSPIKAV